MNLLEKYNEVKKRLEKVDFSALREGFAPLKFALYDNTEVCLDGVMRKKTDEFLANTAIKLGGEYVAIWNLVEETDLDVLSSKLAHEMYHGYQMMCGETRFPNELEAVRKYRYSAQNLSMKLRENALISKLVESFSKEDFEEFLSLRTRRRLDFPYEFAYEAAIEEIEGTANYVEIETLGQLSREKYKQKLKQMRLSIERADALFPIRVVSYDVGALLIKLVVDNKIPCDFSFGAEPFVFSLTEKAKAFSGCFTESAEVARAVEKYDEESKRIVDAALLKNDCVLSGEYELLGVNVYDARCVGEYLVSTYFVSYKDGGKEQTLYGNFVIKTRDDCTITAIYRCTD